MVFEIKRCLSNLFTKSLQFVLNRQSSNVETNINDTGSENNKSKSIKRLIQSTIVDGKYNLQLLDTNVEYTNKDLN